MDIHHFRPEAGYSASLELTRSIDYRAYDIQGYTTLLAWLSAIGHALTL